jgi:hypothetical protein
MLKRGALKYLMSAIKPAHVLSQDLSYAIQKEDEAWQELISDDLVEWWMDHCIYENVICPGLGGEYWTENTCRILDKRARLQDAENLNK